ncbi:MAG: HAMP domain-containing histidine kinase [Vicinamibacteria bacterium]|nr:HAMP domain-containing histidine kinase [Vicinamibacteria bacterium]
MTSLLSLRARLLIGAVLWTVGLLVLSSVALTRVMTVHPRAPIRVHRALEGYLPVVVACACMVIGFLQVRRGLSAVDALRRNLGALHTGEARRLEGAYPSEVQPLVDDLNTLLEQRDRAVERAIAKAGDLAHGLKTPLAVIAHEADRAAAAGAGEVAESVHQQVDRMRRQVDYHLAHARAASGRAAGQQCAVRESVEGLVRALTRLHADRQLTIDVSVDRALLVQGRREDIDEMLGNILDNACRFARSRVAVAAASFDNVAVVTIDDDGPGLDPALRAAVLQRGVRADESGPGSGLGLAIVRNLVELYGATIALSASPLGGLRVQLRLST